MEMKEKRKLQELGGSLYLSVPSSWVSKFNLSKGSEIIILPKESGELQIFPEKKEEEREKLTTIEYDKYFFRNLIRDYLFGSDIIKVKKKEPFATNERKDIVSKINSLLNLEIIEEEANIISIQNLKSDIPIKKMIARMYYLTRSMLQDLATSKNKAVLNNIIERDKLVNKFYLAIITQQRALLTNRWSKELSFVEILDLRLLIERVEQIGDEIKNMAGKLLSGERIRIDDIKFVLAKYAEAYTAYTGQDIETAKKFWDTEKEDKKRLDYDENLIRIYSCIKDIADLVI